MPTVPVTIAVIALGALALAAVYPGQSATTPTSTPTTGQPLSPAGPNATLTGGGAATNATNATPLPPPPAEEPAPEAPAEGNETVVFVGDRALVVAKEVGGLRVVATIACVPLIVGGETGNDAAELNGPEGVDCDPEMTGGSQGTATVTCKLNPPTEPAGGETAGGTEASSPGAPSNDEVVDCVALRMPVEEGAAAAELQP